MAGLIPLDAPSLQGTRPLVLKKMFRIPKIPPPDAPGCSFSHHKPQNPGSRRYKHSLKHMATAEATTAWFCRQALEFSAKLQLPSHKRGAGEGPTDWEMCSAPLWFPWQNKPCRLMAKLPRHKGNAEFGVWRKPANLWIIYLVFLQNMIGDFPVSFQKESISSHKHLFWIYPGLLIASGK